MSTEEIKMETKPKLKYIRMPLTDPVDITFQNIKYTASLGFGKGHKEILHKVCGKFLPSQLIAIMGPSGAGKSTLLDILSGYRITGVEGSVDVNGGARILDEFRRMSCYITQDDQLQMLLTVKENMKVAADLKLDSKYNENEKWTIIEEILVTLGLYDSLNTRAELLSGGEKKRLSIALELVNNPPVLFLDEPTTGLDSASCHLCIKLLKELAMQGRTVVCTIHQPSARLFDSFDHVYVLADGECIYQGSSQNLVPYLHSVKLTCPEYHNPADYIIELASADDVKIDPIPLLINGSQNGKTTDWFAKSDKLFQLNMEEPQKTSRFRGKFSCWSNQREISQFQQLKVILKRGFLKVQRDTMLTHMRFISNAVVGLLLGLLFFNCGNDGSRVLDNYNLLFSILIHLGMSTMMLTILTFPMEMSILVKEHFNRWYSLKSFYIMINILDIPVLGLSSLLFCFIVYFMSGQPLDWTRFSVFMVLSILVVFIAQTIGHIVGVVSNSVVNGTFAGPVLFVPMMMFSGYALTFRDMPDYLYWGTYLSFLRYSLEGYVGAIYGMNRQTLPCHREIYCHYKYPHKFLYDIAMNGDVYLDCIIILSAMLIALKVFAYILLRWKILSLR